MQYYSVSFTRHNQVDVQPFKGNIDDITHDVMINASGHRPMANDVVNITVVVRSKDSETAISDALFKILSHVEDRLANDTRRQFYTSLVGREPVYPYIRLGELEHVMQ